MDRIMVAVAIGMGLVFAAGVILGFLVTISMASNREDRLGTLTRQPPDAAARGARRLSRPWLPRHHAAGYRLEQVGDGELSEFACPRRDEINEQQPGPSAGRLPQRGEAMLVRHSPLRPTAILNQSTMTAE